MSQATAAASEPRGLARWWVYQRERFPLVQHGPLVFAFSFCAVSLSRALRGEPGWPGPIAVAVAFVTCLLFFLQLRIADEFKDFEEDAAHRPYRPVPRGLVSLRELGWLFVLAGGVQLVLAWWLSPWLVGLLVVAWAYLAAMCKEFFVRAWLVQRPILYLLSHMLIMPLVDLYATGADWVVAGAGPPAGLSLFLAASFFNGLVIELGRKIRSPEDEEPGVNTYSVLWGRRRAVVAWWGVLAATAACGIATAWHAGPRVAVLVAAVLGLLGAVAVGVSWRFVQNPQPGQGKRLEALSGLWTLGLYGSLGLGPHAIGAQLAGVTA